MADSNSDRMRRRRELQQAREKSVTTLIKFKCGRLYEDDDVKCTRANLYVSVAETKHCELSSN